ncbi:YdcH family protein [Caulobacter sp. NIBR1757]|uniref:YdcH family protein n=1 Tax=Caulobacter sp. NIBR1757 TaxID=3016000 RepID=UPI0022F04641|nr:YdcH family protein [Caulobacter sp. NIBR1757]WGM38572.1 hypothetical protein AMEJIAPC_01475 [Caulobacter sp. NIBR1757]
MSHALINRLRSRHGLLETALREEWRRPRPDDRVLARIKKGKLLLKDRLMALEAAVSGRRPAL